MLALAALLSVDVARSREAPDTRESDCMRFRMDGRRRLSFLAGVGVVGLELELGPAVGADDEEHAPLELGGGGGGGMRDRKELEVPPSTGEMTGPFGAVHRSVVSIVL